MNEWNLLERFNPDCSQMMPDIVFQNIIRAAEGQMCCFELSLIWGPEAFNNYRHAIERPDKTISRIWSVCCSILTQTKKKARSVFIFPLLWPLWYLLMCFLCVWRSKWTALIGAVCFQCEGRLLLPWSHLNCDTIGWFFCVLNWGQSNEWAKKTWLRFYFTGEKGVP